MSDESTEVRFVDPTGFDALPVHRFQLAAKVEHSPREELVRAVCQARDTDQTISMAGEFLPQREVYQDLYLVGQASVPGYRNPRHRSSLYTR